MGSGNQKKGLLYSYPFKDRLFIVKGTTICSYPMHMLSSLSKLRFPALLKRVMNRT